MNIYIRLLLTILFVHFVSVSKAQEERKFTVKEGMSIAEVLPDSEMYLYPKFLTGKVIYKNGTQNTARMNYNLIIGKMQFIRNSKDTVAIANAGDASYFLVANDTFLYNRVYYRLVKQTPKITLASNQYLKVLEVRKEGGYGMASPTAAVDSYSTITTNEGFYKLKTSAETLFSIRKEYYFGTGDNDFVIASQKNLLKMFPQKADMIKKYIKSGDLNFKNEADLEQIIKYINILPD